MKTWREMNRDAVAREAVAVLNRALAADPVAMNTLFAYRVNCNQQLSDDPTIQVASANTVSVLGLINGLLGIRPNGYGYVTAVFGPDDMLVTFQVTNGEKLFEE